MRLRVSGNIQRTAVIICLLLVAVCVLLGFIFALFGYQALLNVGGGTGSAQSQAQNHLTDLGNFGSFFQGPVASIWALAGIFLIFVAFIGQESQLNLQRETLAEQRTQFTKQDEAARKQNFEATLFQMLNMQNQIASEMKTALFVKTVRGDVTSHVDRIIEGRDCFEKWFSDFRNRLSLQSLGPYVLASFELKAGPVREEKSMAPAEVLETVQKVYERFYEEQQANLAHYFDNLFYLIQFIDKSQVSDKAWYANLAVTQLSRYELALLFYHGLSPCGEKLRPLIKQFDLVKNTDKSLIREEHIELYGAL